MRYFLYVNLIALFAVTLVGCTAKVVGDRNRPITIEAHVTIDIRGLQQTASSIEDYVSGDNKVSLDDLVANSKK